MKIIGVLLTMYLVVGCSYEKKITVSLPLHDNRWEPISGTYADNPVRVRINRRLDTLAGKCNLIYQAAITVPILGPAKNGLPNTIERENLLGVRRLLKEKLEAPGLAVFALEVETNSTCAYIFYGGKKDACKKAFQDIEKTIVDYKPVFTVKKDYKWISYRWFAGWCNN